MLQTAIKSAKTLQTLPVLNISTLFLKAKDFCTTTNHIQMKFNTSCHQSLKNPSQSHSMEGHPCLALVTVPTCSPLKKNSRSLHLINTLYLLPLPSFSMQRWIQVRRRNMLELAQPSWTIHHRKEGTKHIKILRQHLVWGETLLIKSLLVLTRKRPTSLTTEVYQALAIIIQQSTQNSRLSSQWGRKHQNNYSKSILLLGQGPMKQWE